MSKIDKALSIFVICCIIAYNNVGAFDFHLDEHVAVDEIVSQGALHNDQGLKHHKSDDVACDHCCHANAHMLALCTQTGSVITTRKAQNIYLYNKFSASYIGSPAFRPPIV